MVEVCALTKEYQPHKKAVDSFSFTIPQNETIALLGLNGAGKTTMLRMICGFLPPTSGDVIINSYSLSKNYMDLKRQIGYLPETPSLYLDITIQEFLRYMYRLRLYTRDKEEEAILNVLQQTNLEEHRNSIIGTLSAGFRKRVGIAQAIIHNPSVLILDEPISELDPIQIIEMRNLILSLKKDRSILISSHILSEVSLTADRFLFIKKGILVGDCTLSSLQQENLSLEEKFIQINKN